MKKVNAFRMLIAALLLMPAVMICQVANVVPGMVANKQINLKFSDNQLLLSDNDLLTGSSTSYPKDKKFMEGPVVAGNDLWTVPCGMFSFGENGDYPPLPPGFFGPGSDPFDGIITLEGENSDGSQMPHFDVMVYRKTDAFFSALLPSTVDVPIEIIELRLKSKEPVKVVFNPGHIDSFFDVFFTFDFNAGAGGMNIITKEYPHGGSFIKEFNYYPVITFKEVGNPGNQYVFNAQNLGFPPLLYTSTGGYPWTLSPIQGEFDPIGDNPMILFSNSGSYLQLIPLLKRYDHSFLDMSEMGFPVAWGGSGYNEGEWFYYPNTNWWNVWFYDHPVAPDRRKIIDGMLMIQPRMPDLPTFVEIVFNWSTPAWPGFPEMLRPPLPFDVQDPTIEEMMIVRSQPLIVFQGNLFEPIMVPVPFEILEYNPEWLSIDLRGSNFILMADLQHTCWKEGDCIEFGHDFGDAPEGSMAYINGAIGQFPTCMNTGPAGSFISHAQPSGLFFGGMVDVEMEGNAGTCPMFHPNNYNVDECGTYPYPLPPPSWLDEGLMYPIPLTIVGTAGNEQYLPCGQQTMPLGPVCGLATWGQNLDVYVDASQSQGGYLNVLFDWDQNGVWMGASSCQPPINPNDYVPEHAVQNLQIPAGFVGPVSQLNPIYGFQIGPNSGYVWARFSLTDMPVPIEWDGAGVFEYGETEDYLIEIGGGAQGNLDFGDAPDQPYPTLLANNGARHVIDGVTFLGLSVDPEPDGQPDPLALGDDNNGIFDEDGVFWGLAMPGSAAPIHVITSTAGFLQGWIDFNADGDWSDPGEQIFTDEYIHFGGAHCLNYFVPADAMIGNTFARFRFSTQPGLTYTGLAPNGEVEDYMIEIIENANLKWYQEPCPYLPGLHAHDYTIQGVYTRITLADDWICNGGAVTKIQWWGNYEVDANGNEMRFQGINYFHLSIHAHNPNGCLPVDPEIWGADVPLSVSNEQFSGVLNSEGGKIYSYEFVLPQPFNQIEGTQYWLAITAVSVDPVLHPRWRWQESDRSTSTVLCPAVNKWTGAAWTHIVWTGLQPVRFSEMAFALTSAYIPQEEFDFGDAPDQPYPTLLANNGARHKINPNIYLGNLIDAEPDGQPTPGADGDNLINLDDEDGVIFPKPLVVGKVATIKVKASVAGYLNAWVDFNKNGTWADAGDQIFLDEPLVAGINNLTFTIPAGIKAGPTYARFRFNTTGGLTYYGPAEDGEVEDYKLIIHPPNWGYNPTGSTHLIAVPANLAFDCISLSADDFIGTFYKDDNGDEVCGGAIMWDGVNNQAVIAYGDDQTTPEKDGFDENESFIWKVYYSAMDVEEGVSVAYDMTLPDTDGKFHSNGLSGLTAIKKPWWVSATATPDTICAGETVQLLATVTGGCGTFLYSWSSTPAGFSSNLQNPTDNPAVTTTYHVTVTNSFGDSKAASVFVVVYPLPQLDCPPYMMACEDDPPVKLNTAYPQGGVYSGAGVFLNAGSYWFDPSVGPGTYLITYCFTDPNTGCTNCCEFNFIVHAKPVVVCPDDFTVCIDTPPFDLTGATPPGGIYSGTGVSGGKFYPAVAGAGDHVITYTYTDPQTNCTNFCEFVISVIEVEVECPDDMIVCLNDIPFALTGATPPGGIYSGPGVTGGVFYPGLAGIGDHILTYTYNLPGTNCNGTCEFKITVLPIPQMDCPADFSVCLNSPQILLDNAYPPGGEYSGTGIIFNGGFYYFDPSVGTGSYAITYCFTDPGTGCTNCCEFIITVEVDHLIEIPEGWSGISSYIQPYDPLLDNMLYPMMNKLIILQNLTGVYWPGHMNTLINWDEYSGYAIKVNDDTELPVCGAEVINKTVNLNTGWNIIPVLSSTPVDIVALFSGVNGFQIAKDVAGYGIYWPMFGINTIGNVMPGKAYYVRMAAPGTIDYSIPANKSIDASISLSELSTPWNKVTNTPGSHLVAFNLKSNPFIAGDIIGGFTSEGICAGLALVEHDQPFAVNLNGDDPYGNEKVGFENGELLAFRVYRPSTGEEFVLEVTYNPQMNSGEFVVHGISVVNQVYLSLTGLTETAFGAPTIYPNPSGGKFAIENIHGNAEVVIFNAHGKEIFNKSLILPAEIDLSLHPKGIYFISIKTDKQVFFEKLIKN